MNLHTLVTQHALDITITTKARPNDQFYVSVYAPAHSAHARKSFVTEAEMWAALEQCVAEVSPGLSTVEPVEDIFG